MEGDCSLIYPDQPGWSPAEWARHLRECARRTHNADERRRFDEWADAVERRHGLNQQIHEALKRKER